MSFRRALLVGILTPILVFLLAVLCLVAFRIVPFCLIWKMSREGTGKDARYEEVSKAVQKGKYEKAMSGAIRLDDRTLIDWVCREEVASMIDDGHFGRASQKARSRASDGAIYTECALSKLTDVYQHYGIDSMLEMLSLISVNDGNKAQVNNSLQSFLSYLRLQGDIESAMRIESFKNNLL